MSSAPGRLRVPPYFGSPEDVSVATVVVVSGEVVEGTEGVVTDGLQAARNIIAGRRQANSETE